MSGAPPCLRSLGGASCAAPWHPTPLAGRREARLKLQRSLRDLPLLLLPQTDVWLWSCNQDDQRVQSLAQNGLRRRLVPDGSASLPYVVLQTQTGPAACLSLKQAEHLISEPSGSLPCASDSHDSSLHLYSRAWSVQVPSRSLAPPSKKAETSGMNFLFPQDFCVVSGGLTSEPSQTNRKLPAPGLSGKGRERRPRTVSGNQGRERPRGRRM